MSGEPEPGCPGSELRTSFDPPFPSVSMPDTAVPRKRYLKLSLDEEGQRDRERLQRLREAIELITIVSVVDNKAFAKLLRVNTSMYEIVMPYQRCTHHPEWEFCLFGALSLQDLSVAQCPVTWGSLLGFPDNPWEYSPEFRAAMVKMEAMGLENALKPYDLTAFSLSWRVKISSAEISGSFVVDPPGESSRPFSDQFTSLFDAEVPPVFQLYATGSAPTVANLLKESHLATGSPAMARPASAQLISMDNLDFTGSDFPDMTMALARTAIRKFCLTVDDSKSVDTPQVAVNAGFLLSSLLCGRTTIGSCNAPSVTRHVMFDELSLSCGMVSDNCFAATCSAVAEMALISKVGCLQFLRVQSPSQNRLSWLVYALLWGKLCVPVETIQMRGICLTKATLESVKAVVKNRYPEPGLEDGVGGQTEYGFVSLEKESKLKLCGHEDSEVETLELSSASRFRACYDPVRNPGWVNVVVPGYGICRTQLGDGASNFVRDTLETNPLSINSMASFRSLY